MSRASFDAFIHGEAGATTILPKVEPLASRVGGDSYQAMVADPSLWSGFLARTARLLEIDGVLLGFEHAATAPANAGDPVLLSAIEAVDRLVQTDKTRLGCIGVVMGPISLAATHGEETAKQISIETTEAFCKKRPDLLVLREGAALGQVDIGMPQRKAYNTIKNVAAYYSVPLAIHLENYDPARLGDLAKLKIGHVMLGADQAGQPPAAAALAALLSEISAIAVPLPFSDASSAMRLAAEYRAACAQTALAFTSLESIANDADLAAVRSLISGLKTVV